MVTKMYMYISLDDGLVHYVFYYSKLLHKFQYWRVLPLLGEDIDDPEESELWKDNDKFYKLWIYTIPPAGKIEYNFDDFGMDPKF